MILRYVSRLRFTPHVSLHAKVLEAFEFWNSLTNKPRLYIKG